MCCKLSLSLSNAVHSMYAIVFIVTDFIGYPNFLFLKTVDVCCFLSTGSKHGNAIFYAAIFLYDMEYNTPLFCTGFS